MLLVLWIFSNIEEDDLGVLDAFLDLAEEEHCLAAVNDSVIVGERDVHDWSRFDLVSHAHRAVLDCVHAENGALGRVDDWCAHHRTENATVCDREGTASHVLKADLAVPSLN